MSGKPEEIRHAEAFTAFRQIFEHINSVGMVHDDTDKALTLLESYLKQQAAK